MSGYNSAGYGVSSSGPSGSSFNSSSSVSISPSATVAPVNSQSFFADNPKSIVDYAYDKNLVNSQNVYNKNVSFYEKMNRLNKNMYYTAYDMQLRDSNNAMQRRVEDLRKAGINPLLAARLGGASVPSVNVPYANISMPQMQQVSYDGGAVANAAATVYSAMLNSLNIAKQIKKDEEIAEKNNEVSVANSKRSQLTSILGTVGFMASTILPKIIGGSVAALGLPIAAATSSIGVPIQVWNMMSERQKDRLIESGYFRSLRSHKK